MNRLFSRMFIAAGLLVVLTGMVLPSHVNAIGQAPAGNYPRDPTADISPNPAQFTTVADVQYAINVARTAENAQLGTSIPPIQMPSQDEWDEMTNNARGSWLVNRERRDRMGPSNPGLLPMQGTENNVTAVAQNYADYMLANNMWGHTVDGKDPWTRMNARSAINSCHDFLSVGENLYVMGSQTGQSLTYQVEMAIYLWMYKDTGSTWGHRHDILWYPYLNNDGEAETEGFMGFGVATGGPYSAAFTKSYSHATIVVMNMFDPCATWKSPVAFLPFITAP